MAHDDARDEGFLKLKVWGEREKSLPLALPCKIDIIRMCEIQAALFYLIPLPYCLTLCLRTEQKFLARKAKTTRPIHAATGPGVISKEGWKEISYNWIKGNSTAVRGVLSPAATAKQWHTRARTHTHICMCVCAYMCMYRT